MKSSDSNRKQDHKRSASARAETLRRREIRAAKYGGGRR